jgi:multiple sugar transport system substrate-binding protein
VLKKRWMGLCSALLVVLLLAACGGKSANTSDSSPSASEPSGSSAGPASQPASPSSDGKELAGQTVKMLMPPWYKFTPDFFQKFTDETGIKVTVENMKFGQIHDNIVTTSAGGSAPADIVDIDWSWVGQMGSAKWNVNLSEYLADDVKQDIGILSVFTFQQDNIVALPFFNDFRISMVNTDRVGNLPVDTVENVIASAKQIKASGKDTYPIVTTLEAGENTTHEWMLMTKALGGQVFDDNWNLNLKDHNSPSYKALSYIFQMFDAGLIDPKALGIPYEEVIENFKAGRGSIKLLAGPGQVNEAGDDKSTIKGLVKPILIPGDGTHHTTTAMPEGIMVPANAEHKEAAIKLVQWLASPEVMKETYKTQGGIFPTRNSVIQALFDSGDLPNGDVYAKQLLDVQAIFLQGQPTWYAEFSEAVYTAINSGLKNKWSVDKTAEQIIKAVDAIDKG